MRNTLCFIFSLFLLIGCAMNNPPTTEELARADYGSPPDNFQEIIQSYMSDLLFDPYSAMYSNWKGPSKGWAGGGLDKVAFGYRVCVEINAKNRMGAYTGKKLYHFVLKDGKVIQRLGGYEWGTVGAEQAVKSCNQL